MTILFSNVVQIRGSVEDLEAALQDARDHFGMRDGEASDVHRDERRLILRNDRYWCPPKATVAQFASRNPSLHVDLVYRAAGVAQQGFMSCEGGKVVAWLDEQGSALPWPPGGHYPPVPEPATPEVGVPFDSKVTQDTKVDTFAAVPAGGFIIGSIPEINGAESRMISAHVSQFEAKLIAKHWAREAWCMEIAGRINCIGSYDMRAAPYASTRLRALVESGHLTSEQVKTMLDEAWVALKLDQQWEVEE